MIGKKVDLLGFREKHILQGVMECGLARFCEWGNEESLSGRYRNSKIVSGTYDTLLLKCLQSRNIEIQLALSVFDNEIWI